MNRICASCGRGIAQGSELEVEENIFLHEEEECVRFAIDTGLALVLPED